MNSMVCIYLEKSVTLFESYYPPNMANMTLDSGESI